VYGHTTLTHAHTRARTHPRATHAQVTALEQLYNLNALDEEGMLTKLGRKMAEFPLEPPMSKVGGLPLVTAALSWLASPPDEPGELAELSGDPMSKVGG